MIGRYKRGLKALSSLLKKQDSSVQHKDLKSFILDNNKVYAECKASDVNDISYALYAGILMSEKILVKSRPARQDGGAPVLADVRG